jgi:hypothetical protein
MFILSSATRRFQYFPGQVPAVKTLLTVILTATDNDQITWGHQEDVPEQGSILRN